MGYLLIAGAFGKGIGERDASFFGASGGPGPGRAEGNGLGVEYGDGDPGCNRDPP